MNVSASEKRDRDGKNRIETQPNINEWDWQRLHCDFISTYLSTVSASSLWIFGCVRRSRGSRAHTQNMEEKNSTRSIS